MQVCFYRWLLPTLSSHEVSQQSLRRHWGALIRWYGVPICSHWLVLWSSTSRGGRGAHCCCFCQQHTELGCLWLSAAVVHSPSTSLPTSPLIHNTRDIPETDQNPSKSSNFNWLPTLFIHSIHNVTVAVRVVVLLLSANVAWL